MNERQRHQHGTNPENPDSGSSNGCDGLRQARQEASAFLAAADAAIEGALSGDSVKFNLAARQEGGE